MIIEELILVRLLTKPKEKTTPRYYQDNYKPMHPLSISDVYQETDAKRTENPSDYKPISFHIVTPYLKAFYALYHNQPRFIGTNRRLFIDLTPFVPLSLSRRGGGF